MFLSLDKSVSPRIITVILNLNALIITILNTIVRINMIKAILSPDFYCDVDNLLSIVPENAVGIYFLTHNNKIVYVGQSTDICSRVKQHKVENSKIFNSFYYNEYKEEQLNELEKEFIEDNKPPFNHRFNMDSFINIREYCDNAEISYIQTDKIKCTMTKIYPKDRKILKQKAIQADMTMPEYLEFILRDEAIVEKLSTTTQKNKINREVLEDFLDAMNEQQMLTFNISTKDETKFIVKLLKIWNTKTPMKFIFHIQDGDVLFQENERYEPRKAKHAEIMTDIIAYTHSLYSFAKEKL